MGDCQSASSRSWWTEGECQSLMCLIAWRDIDLDIDMYSLLEQQMENYGCIDPSNNRC